MLVFASHVTGTSFAFDTPERFGPRNSRQSAAPTEWNTTRASVAKPRHVEDDFMGISEGAGRASLLADAIEVLVAAKEQLPATHGRRAVEDALVVLNRVMRQQVVLR